MNTPEFSDQMILKGKRTKRLRPSSSASSSANSTSLVSSPTTSISTEEDEDLANCLILLARGGFAPQKESKFSRRKFTQTPTGEDGMCVYECKTCSRSFPSFQALGGHRASHKKPKSTDSDHKKSPPPPPDNQEKEEEEFVEEAKFSIAPITKMIENKPKVHECSICGAEFASGQALGGHMRRHRSVPAARSAGDDDDDHRVVEKARNMLEVDLNLPAPPEDDRFVESDTFHKKHYNFLLRPHKEILQEKCFRD